jgi:hypothetical protein
MGILKKETMNKKKATVITNTDQANKALIGNKKEKLIKFKIPTTNAINAIVAVPSLCMVINSNFAKGNSSKR